MAKFQNENVRKSSRGGKIGVHRREGRKKGEHERESEIGYPGKNRCSRIAELGVQNEGGV